LRHRRTACEKAAVIQQDKVAVPLSQQLRGRVAVETIEDVVKGEVVVRANEMITDEAASKLDGARSSVGPGAHSDDVRRSAGLCARCYGMDLSRRQVGRSRAPRSA
jgi:DNA-directed RNA polymerase subunit beta'